MSILLEKFLFACNTFPTGDLPERFRSKACFVALELSFLFIVANKRHL
jgi:hypothetical protein